MGTSRTAASHAACLRQESWGRRWTSQKWTTGSDCWDVLASTSDLISAALSRPLLCSHGRALGQSDVWRRGKQSPTVQARRGPLSNPTKPVTPHFLTPPNQQPGTGCCQRATFMGGEGIHRHPPSAGNSIEMLFSHQFSLPKLPSQNARGDQSELIYLFPGSTRLTSRNPPDDVWISHISNMFISRFLGSLDPPLKNLSENGPLLVRVKRPVG